MWFPQLLLTTLMSTRYRARVGYCGRGFDGFQLQRTRPNCRTVQGVLESVLNQRIVGDKDSRTIKVVGAGRTDAGVHARGQAVHFDSPRVLDPDAINSFNRMLPPDVRLWNVGPVPESKNYTSDGRRFTWNAIHESTAKLYSYRLCFGVMNPIERHHRWCFPRFRGDMDELQDILHDFVGTHDYSAFASNSGDARASTVRTVYKVELIHEEQQNYRIDVLLTGALYKQVRNMVSAALETANHKYPRTHIQQLLHSSKVRCDNKSRPAPPEGLTLEHVYFDKDDPF